MSNVKSFFDAHAHADNYYRPPGFYDEVTRSLKNMPSPIKILDLGCGEGSFIKTIAQQDLKGNYLGIDLSSSMIYSALENLRSFDVHLVLSDGFNLPFKEEYQFDLIHLDSVLHHIVGRTRKKSRDLANNLLAILSSRLSEKGLIMIEEFYYGSYIVSTMTADMVFYGLKLINFFHLDLRRISKEAIPGLEASFYSIGQLYRMLEQYGDVSIVKKKEIVIPPMHKIFLHKDFGHISLVVKKRQGGSNGE